ncbi:MAG: tRNA pseudouridine(38-40) synthase TruA [Candidatus Limnocylindria bacterium]
MAPAAQRWARALIEYDGTAFAGSQRQPQQRTVQGELEEALNKLTGERITVRFAGRTDAGVHATGQVIAFCMPDRPRRERLEWAELRRRLNAALAPDVAVRALRAAPRDFDPRRAAVARTYRYRIRQGGDRRPTDRHRALEIPDRLDVAAMSDAAARMVGERDFAALGSDQRGWTVRQLVAVTVHQRGTLIDVTVTGNAFLRRMVRSLVAVLLAVGRGEIAAADVDKVLDARKRAFHGRAAPPVGLTLERISFGRGESTTT